MTAYDFYCQWRFIFIKYFRSDESSFSHFFILLIYQLTFNEAIHSLSHSAEPILHPPKKFNLRLQTLIELNRGRSPIRAKYKAVLHRKTLKPKICFWNKIEHFYSAYCHFLLFSNKLCFYKLFSFWKIVSAWPHIVYKKLLYWGHFLFILLKKKRKTILTLLVCTISFVWEGIKFSITKHKEPCLFFKVSQLYLIGN